MIFGGPAFFIDRSDINTDEIIPAKYLTEISKQALKPHLLEDLRSYRMPMSLLPGQTSVADLHVSMRSGLWK